jgi:hypothetical protein
MESIGPAGRIELDPVISPERYGCGFAGSRAFDPHLLGFKFDVMLIGFANHGIAQVLVRADLSEADARARLSRDVPHVVLQFDVREFRRTDLPASDDHCY